MKSNRYRFDSRSKNEFRKDIKEAHLAENEIARRLGVFLRRINGKSAEIKGHGCDMSGDFIEDVSKVTFAADFEIDGRPVEITRSDVLCSSVLHHKKNKIDSCIKNGVELVFVNDCKTEYPQFFWISAKELKDFTEKSKRTYGEVIQRDTGNVSYRYHVSWFDWKTLPK